MRRMEEKARALGIMVIIVAGLFTEAIKGSDASRIVWVLIGHFVWKDELLRVLPNLSSVAIVFDITNPILGKAFLRKSVGASIPKRSRKNEVRSS